ncbi:MAG: hypothetical protein KAR38_04615, partial [Calditrichia bacterium]|nr:hypothetical protein [Calditrichia bacterium]
MILNKIKIKNPVLTVIIIIAVFYLYNCTNPFSTRNAAPPDQNNNNSQLLTLQTEPDSIIKKMELAFSSEEKEYYNELFLENSFISELEFSFYPIGTYSSQLENWNVDDEKRYFANIVDKPEINNISLELVKNGAWQPLDGDPNNQECYFSYIIKLNYSSGTVQEYSGELSFNVIKEQHYFIYSW